MARQPRFESARAIAALPSPQKEIPQAAMAGCSDVSRTCGIVALLTKQLNWTPAQLGNFFATAYALPA